jgi:hypothetical protein
MDWPAWTPVLIAVAVVVLIGAASFVGLYFFTSHSRRDAEGAQIQQVFASRVAREPALAASLITFDIDVHRRGPVRVTVTGQVPSETARTIARHVIQRAAARLDRPVHVVDHLDVIERRAG